MSHEDMPPATAVIDLRSDTVTMPTPAMVDAMHHAAVGDDVLGDDPTVNELQDRCADMFRMFAQKDGAGARQPAAAAAG